MTDTIEVAFKVTTSIKDCDTEILQIGEVKELRDGTLQGVIKSQPSFYPGKIGDRVTFNVERIWSRTEKKKQREWGRAKKRYVAGVQDKLI